jgi:uncharacterized protein (DUF433 family)
MAGMFDDPRQAEGMQSADSPEEEDQLTPEQEEKLVAKFFKEYDRDRKFDENFRKQVAIDRRYAAGTSDLSWAVTTNLIGAFIDILVALLYARDPDVSVSKAPQANNANTANLDGFARTLEIVISKLWLRAKLKKAARKGVRSVLSNAEGWLKCLQVSEKVPNAEIETALNDARELHERLVAQQKLLEDPDDATDPDTREAMIAEKEALIEDLEAKMELSINKMFVIDFLKTENVQVSTDVECIADYLDANWIANEMYVDEEEALTMFPDLTPQDIKKAKKYYQTQPKELTTRDIDNVLPQGMLTAESAQAFTTSTSEAEGQPFVRVIERWYRTDRQIRTAIDGVKKWAKQPFEPPYPTSRFYPYFYISFYEVDGQRHAQSLSWRLYKLQDEYSGVRSNYRITRERSIAGVLVNGTQLDDVEMKKVTDGKLQEFIVLKPADPDTPIGNLFAAKPVPQVDVRLFDVTMILNDMERISGVQEALSAAISGPGNPKTATEANIQQSGTNARTTSDRDCIEWALTDLAQYTAEIALQCYTVQEVQKMAGPDAMWPGPDPQTGAKGLSIEDLFNMVEIAIAAGTTGKPKMQTDQQAWATILPLIRETIGEIEQALASGNKPLADALTALIQETMLRFGDESDIDRFIPKLAPPGTPGAGASPTPAKPPVSVSIRGEITPAVAAALVAPDLPAPAPGAPPAGAAAPGAMPGGSAQPAPGAGSPAPPQVGP